MSSEAKVPVAVNPAEAAAALDEDLPNVLRGRSLHEAGWRRTDPLTLLVPLWARAPEGRDDFYLLRLHFGYYRTSPPSAQFVNPATLTYVVGKDSAWLPRIEGCEQVQVHANYDNKSLQLICCSNTLEFYQVRHGVKPEHVWDPKAMNFAATINAIEYGLRPNFYKGRMT